jgi:hypothetical protein
MKKYFTYTIVCSAICLILIRCSKDNSKEEKSEKGEEAVSAISTKDFADRLVTASESQAMIARYDQLIGSLIENKFREQNPAFVSPNRVIHEIEPLIQYLTYLKQNGNTYVNIRFAAMNGDGINNRIPGLPYHTILFTGNKARTEVMSMRTTADSSLVYNHGSLAPPPGASFCEVPCNMEHTHECPATCTESHLHNTY